MSVVTLKLVKGDYNMKNTLGDKIKEARKGVDLTQLQLAEKLGVGKSSVNMWESNARVPRIDNLKEIIKITNVPADFFLEAFDENVYYTDEERALLFEKAQKNASAKINLTDANYLDGIELTEKEKEKILNYARFVISERA